MSKQTISGTREWAASSVNVMLGCRHDCRYCYARSSAVRSNRCDVADWPNEVAQASLIGKDYGKRQGTVMFPTTHDITLGNAEHTLPVLDRLLAAGNKVLIVSKPSPEIVAEMCKRFDGYKERILFRFTLGSISDPVLRLWEPGAPCAAGRVAALRHAYEAGFATSVSMEPMLDTDEDEIVACYEAVAPFVTDYVWLGKMNKAMERLQRNGFGNDTIIMEAAVMLVDSQCNSRIHSLYARLRDRPHVKWKESIKEVVGIPVPMEVGLDV